MIDLAALRALIESERLRFDVPGVAVAVVVDGELVLADGFGVRDITTGDPVTSLTMFPIASDTKCFTAATLCALADRGDLDLDAPLREYIPWFRMHDPVATEQVSCRDLLSHRTGLPRHDLVWYGEQPFSLEDAVRSLRHLPLSKQLRQTWQYNNLGFSTAGYLTEVLTGATWREAVQSTLLDPLEMASVQFSAHDVAEENLATPYREVGGELLRQVLPARTLQLPAGGIVAHVDDLARWVLARLGGGVLSDEVLGQLHQPAMVATMGRELPDRLSRGYALGCYVESYRGHELVHHGGNLVGYASNVAIAPALQAAVVVLTNRHNTELPDALVPLVLDMIVGMESRDWGATYLEFEQAGIHGAREAAAHTADEAAGRPPSRPVEDFAGTYSHPAYGDLVISVAPESPHLLDAEFHGLGDRVGVVHRDRDAFSLELREFEVQAPVIFTTDDADEINGLTVPLEPLVDAIAFAKQPAAVTDGLLEAAPGIYANGPIEISVTVVNDVINVVAPSVGSIQLTPRGGSVFGGRGMPLVRVEFDGDRVVIQPFGVFTRSR